MGRKTAIEGFEIGNIFVLVMSDEVCARQEFELGNPATVVINFELPPTIPLLLHRLYTRTNSDTCVHDFFSSDADVRLSQPLLKVLEEAGHHVPPELEAVWSTMDQQSK